MTSDTAGVRSYRAKSPVMSSTPGAVRTEPFAISTSRKFFFRTNCRTTDSGILYAESTEGKASLKKTAIKKSNGRGSSRKWMSPSCLDAFHSLYNRALTW